MRKPHLLNDIPQEICLHLLGFSQNPSVFANQGGKKAGNTAAAAQIHRRKANLTKGVELAHIQEMPGDEVFRRNQLREVLSLVLGDEEAVKTDYSGDRGGV